MYRITRATIQLFCRICLKSIHHDDTKTHKVQDVEELLFECTGLLCDYDDEESLPKKICDCCYTTLRNFNEFQGLAKQSHEYLKDLLHREKSNDDFQESEYEHIVHPEFLIQNGNQAVGVESRFEDEADDELEEFISVKNETPLLPNRVPQSYTLEDIQVGVLKSVEREATNVNDIKDVKEEQEELSAHPQKAEITEVPKTSDENQTTICLKNTSDSNPDELFKIEKIDITESDPPEATETQASSSSAKPSKDSDLEAKSLYELRMKIIRQGNPNFFDCSGCLRSFNSKGAFHAHIKKISSASKFGCSNCCKIFETFRDLHNHARSMHAKKRSPSITDFSFVCKVCSRCFCQRSQLDEHLEQHSAELALICRVCGRFKSSMEELKQHMELQHTEQTCSHCNKTFKNATVLRSHVLKVHIKPCEVQVGKKCSKCDMICENYNHWRRHSKTHKRKPPQFQQVCKICSKIFRYRASLAKHEELHGTECKAKFQTISDESNTTNDSSKYTSQ